MTRKLDPHTRHAIVKNYLLLQEGLGTFESVKNLCGAYGITRNVPRKLVKIFQDLRTDLYPGKELDYSVNIFNERSKLRKHRTLPKNESYKDFIKRLPRGGYQTYVADCNKDSKHIGIKEGLFYYYKKSMKAKTGSRAPHKKPGGYKKDSKPWFKKLYKDYDFVIQVDGKSMEDQERIRKNPILKESYKRISMATEVQSGLVLGTRLEKSHNKSNAYLIFVEICEFIKYIFGEHKRIYFITDAGSEYCNDNQLRGVEITDIDTSKIAEYLRNRNHTRRLTRKPEDNGYIENKNDYIERSCLDDQAVKYMNKKQFIGHLDEFIQRNNIYLEGSKKSFRGKGITPLQNIQSRFGEHLGYLRVRGLHAVPIEKLYNFPHSHPHEKYPLCYYIEKFRKSLKSFDINVKLEEPINDPPMHPKSLDSSEFLL